MNTALLALGSNYQRKSNLLKARTLLTSHFPNICFSEAIYTTPVNCNNPEMFLNQVAYIKTDTTLSETTALLKQIEKMLGRTPEDKSRCHILIDIDLLQWNDQVLKPKDISQPYIKQLCTNLFTTKN